MINTGGRRVPNDPWFVCLPSCDAQVPCGPGRHVIRWEAGALRLPDHPDPEAELVLAALGGEKARCVEVAEAWGRHADDLTVLGIGPRGPADEIVVGWDDVDVAAQASPPGPGPYGRPRSARMRLASPPAAAIARASARRTQFEEEREQVRLRRNDMLSLLALGYGFQARLIGQVVAANAGQLDDPEVWDERGRMVRPTLVAGLVGRLLPVAEDWLGMGPGQLDVSLHEGPGWGTVELAGSGGKRRLRVSLPAGWLARVWACGLALTGGHLVVAVERAGWPDARVLALRAPGAEPVLLDVHGSDGRPGAADAPHWEI